MMSLVPSLQLPGTSQTTAQTNEWLLPLVWGPWPGPPSSPPPAPAPNHDPPRGPPSLGQRIHHTRQATRAAPVPRRSGRPARASGVVSIGFVLLLLSTSTLQPSIGNGVTPLWDVGASRTGESADTVDLVQASDAPPLEQALPTITPAPATPKKDLRSVSIDPCAFLEGILTSLGAPPPPAFAPCTALEAASAASPAPDPCAGCDVPCDGDSCTLQRTGAEPVLHDEPIPCPLEDVCATDPGPVPCVDDPCPVLAPEPGDLVLDPREECNFSGCSPVPIPCVDAPCPTHEPGDVIVDPGGDCPDDTCQTGDVPCVSAPCDVVVDPGGVCPDGGCPTVDPACVLSPCDVIVDPPGDCPVDSCSPTLDPGDLVVDPDCPVNDCTPDPCLDGDCDRGPADWAPGKCLTWVDPYACNLPSAGCSSPQVGVEPACLEACPAPSLGVQWPGHVEPECIDPGSFVPLAQAALTTAEAIRRDCWDPVLATGDANQTLAAWACTLRLVDDLAATFCATTTGADCLVSLCRLSDLDGNGDCLPPDAGVLCDVLDLDRSGDCLPGTLPDPGALCGFLDTDRTGDCAPPDPVDPATLCAVLDTDHNEDCAPPPPTCLVFDCTDPTCPEGGCPPWTPPRPAPPKPQPSPLAGRVWETNLNETGLEGLSHHDWDGDGIPDPLDAVNAADDAQNVTSAQDYLALPEGLVRFGFALLLEPAHRQAVLVLADEFQVLQGPRVVNGSVASSLLWERHGAAMGQVVAQALHADLEVRLVPVLPEQPLNVSLSWAPGPLPADGSWLLGRTSPVHLVDLVLAGESALLAGPAPSQFSGPGVREYRWDFLNLHGEESFCFDPATTTGLASCRGAPPPGWVRAYTGHAAYTLTTLAAGFESGLLPLTSDESVPVFDPAWVPWPDLPGPPADAGDADGDGWSNEAELAAGSHAGVASSTPESDEDGDGVPNQGEDAVVPQLFSGAYGVVAKCHAPYRRPDGSVCASPQELVSYGLDAVEVWPWLPPTLPGTAWVWDGVCRLALAGDPSACRATSTLAPSPEAYAGDFVSDGYGYRLIRQVAPTGDEPTHGSTVSAAGVDDAPSLGDAEDGLRGVHEAYPVGVGVDYGVALAVEGPRRTFIAQLGADALTSDASAASFETSRRFVFEGSHHWTWAVPRNLTHVEIGIRPLDEDEAGQAFLLDGRVLVDLLDVRPGETLEARIDPAHVAGFRYVQRDANGDGVDDLLVWIPHFSQTWIEVTNPDSSADFWDVELTGPTTGWVSGGQGAVYRYQKGPLERVDIPGIDPAQKTLGLAVVSDQDFFVVGDSHCSGPTHRTPFIARYRSGSWTVTELPVGFTCFTLVDVWTNADASLAYAGGSEGSWVRYTPETGWLAQARPTRCPIMDIEFDAQGRGLIGVDWHPQDGCANMILDSAIMSWSGSTWTRVSGTNVQHVFDVLSPAGEWAAGARPSNGGPGLWKQSGSSWTQDGAGPSADLYAVSRAPGDATVWAVGRGLNNQGGHVYKRESTQWMPDADLKDPFRTAPFHDFELSAPTRGLLAGSNMLLEYLPNRVPVAQGDVSPLSGRSWTVFSASATGSFDPDGDALAYAWSWGDGVVTAGFSAAHRYDEARVGDTFPVTLTVTDARGGVASRTWSVSVVPQGLGPESWSSASFAEANRVERHHYVVPASSQARGIRLELQAGSGFTLAARLGAPVGDLGSWPELGAQDAWLQGTVPGSQPLYLTVTHAAGASPLSYQVRARLVEDASQPYHPNLDPAHQTPRRVSYLDSVPFHVTYKDPEGDAPQAPPTLTVDGRTFTMYAPYGTALNYQAGVLYHYIAIGLTPGRAHTPQFEARDNTGTVLRSAGGSVFIQRSHVAWHDFESSAPGQPPQGFTKVDEPNAANWWHVVDTRDAAIPARVAVGGHGRVAWFANPDRGTYDDPEGRVSRGSLLSPAYDLRALQDPVLSFSSFYETEEVRNAEVDRKLVQVRWRDPANPASTWSSFAALRRLDGYEDGYGAWRTVTIPLQGTAAFPLDLREREVQFAFTFDSVDRHYNNFLGWFLDDVTVANDHDEDQLPDEVERRRNRLQWAGPLDPWTVPEGGSARRYIRAPDRPGAQHHLLELHVSHPDPSRFRVNVGVEGRPDVVAVYNHGGAAVCMWGPPRPPVEYGYASSGAEVGSSQVFLLINMTSCFGREVGAPGSTLVDWFVEVVDDAGDARRPTVDFLRWTSWGRTDLLLADTDQDTTTDGDELAEGTDPLGWDLDGDGLHERIDEDETVPQWAPALQVRSQDFRFSFLAEFQDLRAYLPEVSFRAVAGNGATQALPAQRWDASSWRVEMPSSFTPASVAAAWRDVYGNRGEIAFGLAGAGSNYGPVDVTATYVTTQGAYVIPVQTPFGDEVTEAFGVFGNVLSLANANPYIAPAAAVVGLFAFASVLVTWEAQDEPAEPAWRAHTVSREAVAETNAVTGALLVASATILADLKNGVSLSELREALRNAQHRVVNPDGSTRWFWERTADDLIVVVSDRSNNVLNYWKWILPGAGYGTWGTIENWLKVERDVAQDLANEERNENEHDYRKVMIGAEPKQCEPARVRFQASGDGIDHPPTVAWLDLDSCVLEALRNVNVLATKLTQIVAHNLTGPTDNLFLGEFTLRYELAVASEVFPSQPGFQNTLTWYWGPTQTDGGVCASPDARRRCSDFTSHPPNPDKPFGDASGPQVLNVNWTQGDRDLINSKGLMFGSRLDPSMATGEDPVIQFKKQLEADVGQFDLSGYDADLRVAYNLADTGNLVSDAGYHAVTPP